MSAGRHVLTGPASGHKRTSALRPNRLASSLLEAIRAEPVFSACVAIIALHLAAVALLFPGGTGVLVRGAILLAWMLIGPVLVLSFAARGRTARMVTSGLIGLAATVAGLATSVPHAVLTGISGGIYTGILATAAGIVLVVRSFREALNGRRRVVKLAVGVLAAALIAQWLVLPAINVGVITHAPRPAVAAAGTLGLAGALASSASGERAIDQAYRDRIGPRASVWYLPDTGHTAGLSTHPVQYAARALAFLAKALQGR